MKSLNEEYDANKRAITEKENKLKKQAEKAKADAEILKTYENDPEGLRKLKIQRYELTKKYEEEKKEITRIIGEQKDLKLRRLILWVKRPGTGPT